MNSAKSIRRKRSQVVVVPGDTLKCRSLKEKEDFAAYLPQVYVGNHLTRSWSREQKIKSKEVDDVNETGTPPPEQHYYFQIEQNDKYGCCSCFCFRKRQFGVNNSFRNINNNVAHSNNEKQVAHSLCQKGVIPQDIISWRESFESLLENPAGQHMFQSFLESEVADENILFWMACENLKKEKTIKMLERKIKDLYNTYISVYSPHEVNIDYKMREEIVENMKHEPDPLIFRAAQMQIYHLMHRDSYPRFVTTILTEELEKELAKQWKGRKNNKKRHQSTGQTSITDLSSSKPIAVNEMEIINESLCENSKNPKVIETHQTDEIVVKTGGDFVGPKAELVKTIDESETIDGSEQDFKS